jgi:hypothetical protein
MLSLCVSGGPSRAQTPAAAAPTSPVPAAVEAGAAAPPAGTVSVAAQFSSDQGPIRSGLEWRIFRLMPDGASALQERSKQNTPVFKLDRGDYIVHVAYGFASASKRLTVGETPVTE